MKKKHKFSIAGTLNAVNSHLKRWKAPVFDQYGGVSAAQADEVVLKAIAPFRYSKSSFMGIRLFDELICRVGLGTSESDVALLITQNMLNLSPAVQKQAVRAVGSSIDSAARLLMESRNPSDREAAAATLCQRRSLAGAPLLARLAGDDSGAVRERAVESLLMLSRSTPAKSSLWEALDQAFAMLADSVMDLPDRMVLRAVLPQLATPGKHLSRVLEDGEHPANFVFRLLVRRNRAELGSRELVRLLGVDAVAPAALDALQSTTVTTDDWVGALSAAHLLQAPARRARVRRVPRRDRQFPSGAIVGELPPSALRSLPGWLASNHWEGEGLAQAIERIVGCEDPAARATLVVQFRQSKKRSNKLIRDALLDLSFDRCSCVSRSALLSVLDVDSRELRSLVRRQLRSPVKANRIGAMQTLHRRDPWAPLDQDDALADATALRRALKRDHDSTIQALRQAIGAGAAKRRIRAIILAIRVEAASLCELELLTTAASRDPKLTASAIVALGRLTTQGAVQAVRACLHHDDDRVRANAVEAAARHDSLIEPVRHSLASSFAREKCNAVHVLLGRVEPKLQAQGRAALNQMLDDERADHRRSALWLVERLGCTEVAGQVASLVSNDSNAEVRTRAQRTARRLLAEMRAGSALCLNVQITEDSLTSHG